MDSDDHILSFVSGGPKNYAYTTVKGKQTCKIRGFTLNHTNAQLLNFDSVQDMVHRVNPSKSLTFKNVKRKRDTDETDDVPAKIIRVTNPSKICRDKFSNIVYNRQEHKKYRVVYDKRVILENLDTVPYGYKNSDIKSQ